MDCSKIIEIMGKPTKSEITMSIESLSYEINALDRLDFYLFLSDNDTEKVMETASYSKPAPEKFLEKWADTWSVKHTTGGNHDP